MEIKVDTQGSFKSIGKNIEALTADGFKHIMLLHREGGIDSDAAFKSECDKLAQKAAREHTTIFGGIFPGIIDNGRLMDKGTIIIGIRSDIHCVTLEDLTEPAIMETLKTGIAPIEAALAKKEFKTLFVFGDGFGELNLNLMNALNRLVKKYPINVIGGLTGRNRVQASSYTIFSPEKVIQNGAVLVFTRLKSGIGAKHGWEPLPNSNCKITKINGNFVEEINGRPAVDCYMDFITRQDPVIEKNKNELLKNSAHFFDEVAIKYPLGIIRKQKNRQDIIDRTPLSVGGDKSLQFSAEIPVDTRACILHLRGESPREQCGNMKDATQLAYIESLRNFPGDAPNRQVMIMGCFGRKKMVEKMAQDYEDIEFKLIAADQQEIDHSPFGPLTFGEISSMKDGYVELHNKTAVIGTIEDD